MQKKGVMLDILHMAQYNDMQKRGYCYEKI